jgi:hypothetical protein
MYQACVGESIKDMVVTALGCSNDWLYRRMSIELGCSDSRASPFSTAQALLQCAVSTRMMYDEY